MAYNQQHHDDSESDGYDYDYDYNDYPAQHSTNYTPLRSTNMLTNAFSNIQTSLVQRISPSRTMQTNLAPVPEASEEGSDRQSVMTASTGDTAGTAPPKGFTEHSLSEVRRVNTQSYDDKEDPFAETPRDSRSIAYRFASALSHTSPTLPLPASHVSRDGQAYASGASRSPTPLRDTARYRRVQDEEQGSAEDDYFGDQDEDEDEKDAADVADSLRPYSWATTYATYVDPEKDSLASSNSSTLEGGYSASPLPTRHFGPAPIGRVQRRHKKVKKGIRLTNGNLVVDLNVPPKLVKVLPVVGGVRYEEKSEMTKTRYTAVTCDPDEFEKRGFFLRQNELGRTTELFIVITMYNVCTTSLSLPGPARADDVG